MYAVINTNSGESLENSNGETALFYSKDATELVKSLNKEPPSP